MPLTGELHRLGMAVVIRRTSEPPTRLAPSRSLLPADGALAAEAGRLIRRFTDPSLVPPAWSEAAFIRDVDLVRAHLAPIRSREGLAASFSREAFHATPREGPDDVPGAVRVAYALRWLELRRGRSVPAWPPATIASDAAS